MEGERKEEEKEKAVEEKLLFDFHQANPSTERQFIPVPMDQYPCTPSLILRLLLPALGCGLPLELGSLVPLVHRPTAAALTHVSQLYTQHEVQLPGSTPQSPGPYFQMAICLGMSKHDQEGWAFRAKEMETTSCCVTIFGERRPDKNEYC